MKVKILDISPSYEVIEEGQESRLQRNVIFEAKGKTYTLTISPPSDEAGLRSFIQQAAREHLQAVIKDFDDPKHKIIGEEFTI